jgi:endo-1,4-beta-xylanase
MEQPQPQPPRHRAPQPVPEQPRQHGAHHAAESHTRRNVLLAAAGATVLAATASVYARVNHAFGWGEVEPETPHDPGNVDHQASDSPEPGAPLPPEFDRSHEIDTIKHGNWKFMPGVKPEKDGLSVRAVSRSLRPEVGTDVYANPDEFTPVASINLYGTVMEAKGDFGLSAKLSDLGNGNEASLVLHSAPDLVFDERSERAPSVKLTVKDGTLQVTVQDAQGAGKPQEVVLPAGDSARFWVKQQGGKLVVGSGDKSVTVNANLNGESGLVWFGFDGSKDTNFRVDELKAYPVNGSEVKIEDTSRVLLGAPLPNGFQTLADKKRTALHMAPVEMGTTFADFPALMRYPYLRTLVGNQVGTIKPEDIGKMNMVLLNGPDEQGNIRPEDFNWAEMDAFMDLAERNDKKVHMHALIFGEALPAPVEQFLQQVAEGKLPRSAAKNFMQQYITTFVARYKDRIKEWDVVNEPLADTDNFDAQNNRYRKNAWFKAFGGTEYVRVACEAAKHAGAEKVIINDNGMETDDDRAQAMIDLASELRNQGYVDGVGFQSHLDSGPDSDIDSWSENGVVQESYVFDDMTTRFNQFRNARLDVWVSEISIDSDNQHEQAVTMHGFMRAAMRAGNVRGICWWGLATGPFYMTSEKGSLGNDAPWAWDAKTNRPIAKETVGGVNAGLTA